LVFSVLLLIGGVLLFASPFAYPLSTAETEAISTVDLSFVLSLGNPSHNMSLESTTTEVEILKLESNDTPLQIVTYGVSGVFLELSNVTSIQNLVLDFYHDSPWDIGFIRESGDANVSVVARIHRTALTPLITFGPHMILFGMGATILGISLWWFYGLDTSHKAESDTSGSRQSRPALIVVLMLLSSLCFTPITVIYGIYGGPSLPDPGNWLGYMTTVSIELNASHPQEQVEVYPYGGFPALVHIIDFSGESVLMGFQTESATEEFTAGLTPQNHGSFHIELQNDTVLTLTRVNVNVTLVLWLSSGAMVIGHSPNWVWLLSPFVSLPAVVGLILVVNGLTRAKRIDSEDLS